MGTSTQHRSSLTFRVPDVLNDELPDPNPKLDQLRQAGLTARLHEEAAAHRLAVAKQNFFGFSTEERKIWRTFMRSACRLEYFKDETPPNMILAEIEHAKALGCFDDIIVYNNRAKNPFNRIVKLVNSKPTFLVFGVVAVDGQQYMFKIGRWNHGVLIVERQAFLVDYNIWHLYKLFLATCVAIPLITMFFAIKYAINNPLNEDADQVFSWVDFFIDYSILGSIILLCAFLIWAFNNKWHKVPEPPTARKSAGAFPL